MTPSTNSNYWVRRIEDDRAAEMETAHTPRDWDTIGYAAALIVLWIAAAIILAWRTLPGGLEMIPTYVVLLLMYTGCEIGAWRMGR